MEYGILVVEDGEGHYQIVSSVWSIDEALEMVNNYFAHGHASGSIAPESFVIHRRGQDGFYTVRGTLAI